MASLGGKELRMPAAATDPDLHKEVPEVFLEGGDVVVQVEQSFNKDLHLDAEGGIERWRKGGGEMAHMQ